MRMLALALALGAANAQAQTEIVWWHSMGGALGEQLNALAGKFNDSQKDYKITPVYKGSYPETMTAAIAAFRAGNPPHILQVFEVGTATMMAAKGAVKPVYQIMQEAGEPFDPKAYLPAIAGYSSTARFRPGICKTWSGCRRTRPSITRGAPTGARAGSPPASARCSSPPRAF